MKERIWNKWLPIGVSRLEHYSSFGKTLLRCHPIKLEIAPDVLPIISLSKHWNKDTSNKIPMTGSFLAGYLKNIPVIFNPELISVVNIIKRRNKKLTYHIVFEEIE